MNTTAPRITTWAAAHAWASYRPVMPPRDTRPRTPWFEGDVRPFQTGVYERQIRLAPYSYWNGAYWGMSSQTVETAALNKRQCSLNQDVRWRGLAQEPTP